MAAKKSKVPKEEPKSAPDPKVDLEKRVDEMMSLEEASKNAEPKPVLAADPEVAAAETAPTAPELRIPGVEDIDDEKPGDKVEEVPAVKQAPVPVHKTGSQASVLAGDPDEDPTLDPVIDDIVATESDELLARRDAEAAKAGMIIPKPGVGERLRNFCKAWWHNKVARTLTLLAVLAILITLGAVPATRYYALNLAGVRSASSLTVVDNATQLPLKNVNVELGDQKGKTDDDGVVKLNHLQLGTQSLEISQTGFATINETLTLGLGSNPLGDYKLRAVGRQFRITAVDYVSGKPVSSAEIESDESNAKADKDGHLLLTVAPDEKDVLTATLHADGYRDEKMKLEPGKGQNRTVQMVSDRKDIFISKQSGKYDLYKMDIDGQNRQLLLGATGNEDADLSVAESPDGKKAALISRRDTLKNQDGYVLQTLTVINVDDGTTLTLDHSERFQLIDWVNDMIVYVKVKAGTSAGSPDRYQLISYNYDTNARVQLASANYFTGVVSANDTLYYTASNNFQGGDSQFAKINADDTGKQVILDKTDIWNVTRTAYDTLKLSSNQTGFSYTLGDKTATKTGTANPGDNRLYIDTADGKQALWVDNRDGKGVLLVTDTATGKDKVIKSDSGLTQPVRWLDSKTVIYRVNRNGEIADYAVSLDGGDAKKIVDVTATASFGWSY